jgi:DnaJ-class molecular chaperone
MGPIIQQVQAPCGHCKGQGKIVIPNNSCNECNGGGFKLKDAVVNVPLKNGLNNGQQIQLQNIGHNLKSGKTDVIIVIHIKEHEIFKCDNNNLLVNIELELYQALFGFDKIIKHLDNRELHISYSGKTEYGVKRKIVDEGMFDLRTKQKGDLILTFIFKLPSITKPNYIQNIQNILKTTNQEEVNKEVDIRVNTSKYIKTLLLDYHEEERKSSSSSYHSSSNEGQAAQCVHQ